MWQRGGFSEEKTDYMGSERGFTMTYCSLSVQTNTVSEVIKYEREVYSRHQVTKWNIEKMKTSCLDISAF